MLFVFVTTFFSMCLLGCSGTGEEKEELDKLVYIEEEKDGWSLPGELQEEESAQTTQDLDLE